jgi:hypothetical protein
MTESRRPPVGRGAMRGDRSGVAGGVEGGQGAEQDGGPDTRGDQRRQHPRVGDHEQQPDIVGHHRGHGGEHCADACIEPGRLVQRSGITHRRGLDHVGVEKRVGGCVEAERNRERPNYGQRDRWRTLEDAERERMSPQKDSSRIRALDGCVRADVSGPDRPVPGQADDRDTQLDAPASAHHAKRDPAATHSEIPIARKHFQLPSWSFLCTASTVPRT